MNLDDELRDLSRLDFMIDAKTLFHERLASAPERSLVLRVALEELREALVEAESEGQIEPGEAETLLSLGTESLTTEARRLGLA